MKPGHPNNVFWPQAVAANSVFKMLDGRQQKEALVKTPPEEDAVGFKGDKFKIKDSHQGPFRRPEGVCANRAR